MNSRDPAGPVRVLLVEDDPLVAVLLEDMLTDLGHQVADVAGDLDRALELARQGTFDVAVVDVTLKGRKSFPVADVLGERNIPYLFATGGDSSSAGIGNRPTLNKPFHMSDLKSAIARLLSGGES